jgi:beta-glucosidase
MIPHANEFLWGVATSPFQCEGGYNGPGQPQNNWSAAEAAGRVEPSGRSADFWHAYPADFARCRALGLNAFRLGVEWARVQPSFRQPPCPRPWQRFERSPRRACLPPPEYDLSALKQYSIMLRSAMEQGLEPIVTLHHFTHPGWLGSDPWLEETTPHLFAEYVRTTVAKLSEGLPRPIRWFLTINEPNMFVLNTYLGRQFPSSEGAGFGHAVAAVVQMLRAHVLAYNAIHDLYGDRGWDKPQVSLNNYCSDLYWADKLFLDLLCSRERGWNPGVLETHIQAQAAAFEASLGAAHLPLHRDFAGVCGAAVKGLLHRWGRARFSRKPFEPLIEELASAPRSVVLDYIALDYYDPFVAHIFRLPAWCDRELRHETLRDRILATVTRRWWDWRVLPRGLHFFSGNYAADYGRPVLIAENGMALRGGGASGTRRPRRDRISRSQFLRLHLHEVQRLRKEGVPLLGYLHWSLCDNYEWGTYAPRFGLFSVDFDSGIERMVEDPLGDRPSEAYARLLAEVERELAASRGDSETLHVKQSAT